MESACSARKNVRSCARIQTGRLRRFQSRWKDALIRSGRRPAESLQINRSAAQGISFDCVIHEGAGLAQKAISGDHFSTAFIVIGGHQFHRAGLCSGTSSVSGLGEITTPRHARRSCAPGLPNCGSSIKLAQPAVLFIGLLQRRRIVESPGRWLICTVGRAPLAMRSTRLKGIFQGATHIFTRGLWRPWCESDDRATFLAAILLRERS